MSLKLSGLMLEQPRHRMVCVCARTPRIHCVAYEACVAYMTLSQIVLRVKKNCPSGEDVTL